MPQQPPARLPRAAALTLLLFATACGGGADGAAGKDEPTPTTVTAAAAAGVVAPAKVEVIAGLTGCKATIRIEAAELRQGVCHSAGADYLITTFPEERHKETWLDAAAIYGGRYLVGSRWVVSAQPEALTRFQPKLGGEIRQLGAAGPSVAPSAS
ncbi:hypothetical protein ABT300_39900 [Streptomyces sp. NPDC001027]|uniref:hypothetical protein n=1 Tax=Streptomyces sp. NPDC001027 TaxID=3154771 RepID=UPI00332179BC